MNEHHGDNNNINSANIGNVYSDVNINRSDNYSSRPSTSSPVIVPTNADYKRPSSTRSFKSNASSHISTTAQLDRNWIGLAFLSLHFFIGLLLVSGSFFDFIWSAVAVIKPIARSTREINPILSLFISLFIFAVLTVSFKYLTCILFAKSDSFRNELALKKHELFLYSSIGVCLGGLLCVAVHLYIYSFLKATHLTPFLPAGIFLILHGLLSLRLNFELAEGGPPGGVTMMLPYKIEKENEEDCEMEELSDISSKV